MAARCEGGRIEILDRVLLPTSLGFFYTAMCQFIGFDAFGEEYKVMGLAPYGEDRYAELMRRLVTLPADGWFDLAPGWFGMHEGGKSGKLDEDGHVVMGRLYSPQLARELGGAAPRGRVSQREKDIARSAQTPLRGGRDPLPEPAAPHGVRPNAWSWPAAVRSTASPMPAFCATRRSARRFCKPPLPMTAPAWAPRSTAGTRRSAERALPHEACLLGPGV